MENVPCGEKFEEVVTKVKKQICKRPGFDSIDGKILKYLEFEPKYHSSLDKYYLFPTEKSIKNLENMFWGKFLQCYNNFWIKISNDAEYGSFCYKINLKDHDCLIVMENPFNYYISLPKISTI